MNLERESERLDRRETPLSVSESHKPNLSGKKKSERENSLVMLATKSEMREFSEDPTLVSFVLLCKGSTLSTNTMTPLPLGVSNVLQEFSDVFPDEIPAGLPPLRGIEHQIDLIPGASLPNRPHTAPTPMRQRRYSDKYKRFSIKGMFMKV